MGRCDGQVAIVTGAGGGITAATTDDIRDFESARRLIDQAVSESGKVDILNETAGFLRDHVIVKTTEAEWDAVAAMRGKCLPQFLGT